jgi:CTP:molybdopterin cytidylyltransferase MocA
LVVGPPHAEAIARAVPDARRVDNPDPSRGMLSSLQEALRVLAPAARGHVVVALVDQPRVSPAIVRQLLEVLSREKVDAAVPRHAGRGGHPYALARSALAPLLAAPPSASARDVLAQLRRASVEVDDSSILEDLDTADALRAAHAEFEEREAR